MTTERKPITPEELAELRRTAKAISRYHAEHASYGGCSRDFHDLACAFLDGGTDRLIAAAERLHEVEAECEREERRARQCPDSPNLVIRYNTHGAAKAYRYVLDLIRKGGE